MATEQSTIKKENFLKRHWKGCLIAFFIILTIPIVFGLLAKYVFMKPSIVRVTLSPEQVKDTEPFDVYIGSMHIDGGGEYNKLTKVSDTVWEGKNTFGEDEKDLDDWMVIKVKKSDQQIPPSTAGMAKIETRAGGEEFQRGVLQVDYWSQDWGNKEIEQTNSEMKNSNVNWVFLAPPWDITSFDPVKIWNSGGAGMQYTEEQLRNHIRKLKADGLNVIVAPQLCCTKQPSDFAGKSTVWWDEFFRQYENYVLFHARVSEEEGAGVYVVNFPIQSWPGTPGAPSDVGKRWEDIYNKVKQTYKGKVALFDYVCCGAYDEGLGVKAKFFENDFEFFKKADYIVLSLWNAVARSGNPTQEELDANVASIINGRIKEIYDKYKKPIMIQGAYRSADRTSLGTSLYDVDLVPPRWTEKTDVSVERSGLFKSAGSLSNKIPIMTYDGREQAMIYEAIYRNTAKTNWIVGIYPFVYHMKAFDFPRHPDYDIRRKPAETIIADWYKAFKK